MKKYIKYFILSFLVVLGIVLVIIGSSYSLFHYQVKGKTKNKIVTGTYRLTLNDAILNNNPLIEAEPTLTTSSNNTSDASGLYKSTVTNSGNPTYYFRGNVENNYVSFAGQTWRVVRINEDNTVRIIMTKGINDNSIYPYVTSNANNYLASYYTNSNAKTQLESWYNNNLPDYDSYIATGNYCEEAKVTNDSSHSVSLGNVTLTEASKYNPNFKCSTDANNYGNVISKIGLITYDEVVFAGGYADKSNSNYYLYIPTARHMLTMSPAGLRTLSNIYDIWFVRSWDLIDSSKTSDNGLFGVSLSNDSSSTWGGNLLPVINLNEDVVVTGSGTSTDPWTVV